METISIEDFADLATSNQTKAREALIAAVRESGAQAASFTYDELYALGFEDGKAGNGPRVKGSATGEIRQAHTDQDNGVVYVLLAE